MAIHYRIEDVEAHSDERVMTADGQVVRAVWSVTVHLLVSGDRATAGVILTDLEQRLQGHETNGTG